MVSYVPVTNNIIPYCLAHIAPKLLGTPQYSTSNIKIPPYKNVLNSPVSEKRGLATGVITGL
jgi:hypothetical protein